MPNENLILQKRFRSRVQKMKTKRKNCLKSFLNNFKNVVLAGRKRQKHLIPNEKSAKK